ncbi:MAG: hypothetical protein R3C05_02600 [Pirellulaceae bacterium]
MMEGQLGQLVALVDDLLEVSRISRGKMKLRREVVVLNDVIASAVDTCRPMIKDAGHELSVDLPSDAIHLHGDKYRLCQLLANLVNNAAKYTPAGGRIEVSAFETTSLNACSRCSHRLNQSRRDTVDSALGCRW